MGVPIAFPEANTVYRGDGKEIGDLPCFRSPEQTISKWELTVEEIAYIKEHGHVWLSQMNFGAPLQPQCVFTRYPFIVEETPES